MAKAETRAERKSSFRAIPVSGRVNDNFVGIKAQGNAITFYYPEAFDFHENELDSRKSLIALIKSLGLAKSRLETTSSVYTSRKDANDFALNSYLWILNDYLHHGIYFNREKKYTHGYDGKINWKKTMQTNPLVSKNGNVIYLDAISEVKRQEDNLIVEIHRFCVKKSIDFIGWIFGFSSKAIHVPKFTPQRRRLYLNALRKELDQSFDDDKKELLSKMIDVVCGLDSDLANTNEFSYGIDNFYYVFERLVDHVFNGIEDIEEFYPSGRWELVKYPGKIFPSSNLRPDTIIINHDTKTAYILDSKFYRFGLDGYPNINELPESTSIQKQITYAEYIKNNKSKFKIDNVYNAFVLPYNKNKEGEYQSSENLQYIGKAYTDWKIGNQPHETIYAFLIDLKHLVMSWYEHQKTDDAEKLMKEIDDFVSHSEKA